MPKKKSKKSHVKPTKEELEAKVQEAIDAEPEPSEPIPSEPEPQADPSKEMYKKKFSESSRENQKIYAKNRVMNKALVEAEDVPEPTTKELQKEFGDWDVMSDTERMFAKETVVSRRWRETIAKAKDQAKKIEKWNESVEEFVSDPITLNENPELEGKTAEFKEYATSETNNNVPFNVLVGAFLHEHSSDKQSNKGRMFEKGTGGSIEKPKPKSDKLDLEESRKLRERDYNKWKEYVKAGKIEQNF